MAIEHYDEAYRENIRDYLIRRAHAVRVDAKLNLLNLAGLSEDFYAEFLNILLDLQLENANAKERNKAGIDLIDWNNRVVAQVSATCAPNTIRKKIRNSIEKFKIPEGEPWQFYFVPITDQAPDLKSGFDLPDGLIFDESKDVLDITRIMELAKGIDRLRNLSELADKYGKGEALRKSLDELLLRTWKAHRSYKLMQTDEIDKRLFPNVSDSRQFEALGKRTEHDSESPVWSIIRESWNDPTNQPVMIQGKGGIGKTVALFSLTGMDKDTIPAPAVYVPMFELVSQEGKVVNLSEYFQSANHFPSLTQKQREKMCVLATESWDKGPRLLVLLDGLNEVPGTQRWNVLQMLRDWHGKNPGAQLISVSRPVDNLSLETAFGKNTISITLSELTRESVETYLKSPQGNGVRIPEPCAPIWDTIVYPLFLNLYIKTDKLREQEVWKEYPLCIREATGPGSLIWNYLQRELLRHEDDEWILRCAVACEYLAPVLAHHMVRSNDYTVSRRDAVSVIQKALSEMDLERMPSHVAELFSWWGDQTLAMGQPTFLMGLDWPDIVLRESGLLAPYQESQKKKSGKKLEQRFEFLHQNFRDCLAGVYLVNQAETARENEFPEIWARSQSHAALNYASELMDPDVYAQLWEANRKAQAAGNGKNHTATCNLLELWKRRRNLADELDFSGMDLRGLSLTRCLGKDGPALPLFRKQGLSKKTLLDRSVFESDGHADSIKVLAVLPDGRVVSGSYDATLRVWDAATGQCLQTLEGHSFLVKCVAVLPDGRVVSGSSDDTLRVWDTATGQCLQILEGHRASVNCLAVLPDGRVVSGSYDDTLRVWDAATGQCLQTLEGHSDWVYCVAVLPDGRVVSGSSDSTLRVWDAATGQCLQTLEGHRASVNCVAVLPDGRVVSGSDDNTLRVWDAKAGICLDVLEATEVRVSRKNEFQMDFSDAMISEDLAPLLWHNGARISDADYNRWVKPLRFYKGDNLI